MGYDENTLNAMHMALGIYILLFLVMIFVLILYCIFLSQLFRRAGEAGWKAWIPFYAQYTMADLAFGHGFLFLLMFVPYIGQVALIILNIMFAKTFTDRMSILVAVGLMPFIGFMIIAKDDSFEYGGPVTL